jgi:hypothetical protein
MPFTQSLAFPQCVICKMGIRKPLKGTFVRVKTDGMEPSACPQSRNVHIQAPALAMGDLPEIHDCPLP